MYNEETSSVGLLTAFYYVTLAVSKIYCPNNKFVACTNEPILSSKETSSSSWCLVLAVELQIDKVFYFQNMLSAK